MAGTSSPTTDRQLRDFVDRVKQEPELAEIVRALLRREPATVDGVFGSAAALLLSTLRELAVAELGGAKASPPPMLILCPDAEATEQVEEDFPAFGGAAVGVFPWQEENTRAAAMRDRSFGERIRRLKQLLRGSAPAFLVAPAQALLQPVPEADTLQRASRTLRVGQTLDLDELTGYLVECGYHATTAVELPSEFSHRGGILDLFAADWKEPLRIELFDDEIESIRVFDLESQRSLQRLEEVELTVLPSDLSDRASLLDYLPDDTWIVQWEPERIDEQLKQTLRRAEKEDVYFGLGELQQAWAGFAQLMMGRLELADFGTRCRLAIEPLEKFSEELGEMRLELDRIGREHEVYLACPTEGDRERVSEIFASTAVATAGRLHLVEGSLHRGFRLTREKLVALSCDQLLGRHDVRRPPRRRLGKAIDSFLDLREGDLIVHLAHGIGRFRGLKIIEKEGHREEHLELEFHGGTRIYVPAAKIDLVQKYIGGARAAPGLAKIGGKSWLRQKQAAEDAVTDLAAEMLEIQAARSARNGIVYSQDTEWQHEFEGAFPYRETVDQLSAIGAIKGDMESSRSMDRLLCGDVGFGKTEVAMRAAFKAVENGFQVGVLVPTTVLVEQHYRTFRERMASFPFDIAKLSRFCSASERRETLAGLREGRIDIVVGTHRLASRDVDFFNLGLLIIDEEQRFGVEIKERLKSLRTMVDVLTLSATPIPRTLHMSLVGVRDISSLESAPEERQAVETRITRFDDELIRHAALRELNRGGQIYFIHNRVNDIHLIRDRLQYILPEATIGVAHGQMPESELAPVMADFIHHRSDILLATTIVENGLDIPNANTIFINEADRYGLSDLHQLRGRVGRYKHRAYAYLLVTPHKRLTPNASKRLRAIEEFSEMGAGFQISMRDLEIRGAGNLLGTEQSGHIAAIGYELYCQMLERAVRALQKKPPRISLDVDLDLPVRAYLPDAYVTDKRQKIDFYRRLSRIERFDQIEDLRGELADRFGPLPAPAAELLQLAELKLDAAVWQLNSVHLDDQGLVFKGTEPNRFRQLVEANGRRMRQADERTAHVRLKSLDVGGDQLIALVRSILRPTG